MLELNWMSRFWAVTTVVYTQDNVTVFYLNEEHGVKSVTMDFAEFRKRVKII